MVHVAIDAPFHRPVGLFHRMPRHSVKRTGAAISFAMMSLPAVAEENVKTDAPLGNLLVLTVVVAMIVCMSAVYSALIKSTWSLSDALSEEVWVSALDRDGVPIRGADDKTLMISELRASVSRFIALAGLIAILIMYFGFGITILADFAIRHKLPELAEIKIIIYLLLSGVTMFAPYLVNKFSSVFDWTKPKAVSEQK